MSGGDVGFLRGRSTGLTRVLVALLLSLPAKVAGQHVGRITGYSLTLPTASGESDLSEGASALLQQLRVMGRPTWGPVSLDVAYQHNVGVRSTVDADLSASTFVTSSTKWIPLQWTIESDGHLDWTHRFDRLALELGGGNWDATLGRQAISWGTTLFLTPADPFAPFEPSDPFREYRAGVDAARARYYPGPLSEIDMVVRLADRAGGTKVTALARGKTTWGQTDVSVWGGIVSDHPGAALGATRSVGGLQLRGEVSLREDPAGDGAMVRLAVGADRRLDLAGRDLYVVLEYQHDDFGATSPADLMMVFGSEPFRDGEMQLSGADDVAVQGSWQLHPLGSLSLLTLFNLRDGSTLLVPGGSYSMGADVMLRAGAFFSSGDGSINLLTGGLGSEFGVIPINGYLSLAWFF